MHRYIKFLAAVAWRVAIFVPLTTFIFFQFFMSSKFYVYSGPLYELIYATDGLRYLIIIKGILLGFFASIALIVVRNSKGLTYVFLIAYLLLAGYCTLLYIIPAKLTGEFYQAVKSGEVTVIHKYFQFPRNLLFRYRKSARVTPLIWLIANQRGSLANEYIELGNPVDKEREAISGYDPLSALASHLHPSKARKELYDSLISLGAKVNNYTCNRRGRNCITAIQIAAHNDDLDLVKWLVRDGASIDDSRYGKWRYRYFKREDLDAVPTLLESAIGNGSVQVARFLLEQHRLNLSHQEKEKLEALIAIGGGLRAGDSHALKSLVLEHRKRFSSHFLGFLYKHAGPGTKNWELFDWLMDNDIAYAPNLSFIDKTKECDYTYKNERRLYYISPYTITLKSLFSLSIPKYYPFGKCRRALRFIQMEQCRTTDVHALSQGASLAAAAGCTDIVEYLVESLENPLNAYQLLNTQKSATYYAVASGNTAILKLFIDRDITLEDLEMPYKGDLSVFQAALKYEQPSTINYLLDEGLYIPDCADFEMLVANLFPYVRPSGMNTKGYRIPDNLPGVLQEITSKLVEQGFVDRCNFDPAPFLNGRKAEEYKQVFQTIGIN